MGGERDPLMSISNRISSGLFIFLFLFLLLSQQARYARAEENPLVTIDGKPYLQGEILSWWDRWKDEGQPFPETADSFVDWQLLRREADKMQLYREPSFQHKIDVFLKARTLLLLRNEEVDTKIHIDEASIKDYYEAQYEPLWRCVVYQFKEMQEAEKWRQTLLQNLSDKDSEQSIAPHHQDPQGHWYRPQAIPAQWMEILPNLQLDGVSPTIPMPDGSFILIHLLEKKEKDPEGFSKLKPRVEKELYDQQHALLTEKLIERLMGEYHVAVDYDLLRQLKLGEDNDALRGQLLIKTDRMNLRVDQFLDIAKKERELRFASFYSEEQRKQRLINDILAHNLVSWAALDRHYEKKEPFKSVFEFYWSHRLIKELERKIIMPKVSLQDDEILSYYRNNMENFRTPTVVTFAQVDGDRQTLKKIWVNTVSGHDFFETVKKYTGSSANLLSKAMSELEPSTAEQMQSLSEGKISRPFGNNGEYRLIFLNDRKYGQYRPLEEVKKQIITILQREKFDEARKEYIASVRSKSSITVNDRLWRQLAGQVAESHEE